MILKIDYHFVPWKGMGGALQPLPHMSTWSAQGQLYLYLL